MQSDPSQPGRQDQGSALSDRGQPGNEPSENAVDGARGVGSGTAVGDAEVAPPEPIPGGPAARASTVLTRQLAVPLKSGLYLVATPIGNLGDITLRALATLARADVIYCEDTRHSRTLLAHYAIQAPLKPYHDHNADEMRPRVLGDIAAGKVVALISDAGLPLVSDPGFKLVRAAVEAGHHVETLPGPSATLTALASSGLPTDAFLFAGFLPARQAARRARIMELKAIPATLILFEAPTRLAETLTDLAEVLGPRPGVVARELTKLHEEYRRGALPELAAQAAASETRGEIVLLVGPPAAGAAADTSDAAISARLQEALADMSLRDAAHMVAEAMLVPRARVYDLGLKLKRGRGPA